MKRRLYWLLAKCPNRLVYVVFPRASAKIRRIRGIRQATFNRILREHYAPRLFERLWQPDPAGRLMRTIVVRTRKLGATRLHAMQIDEIRQIEEAKP